MATWRGELSEWATSIGNKVPVYIWGPSGYLSQVCVVYLSYDQDLPIKSFNDIKYEHVDIFHLLSVKGKNTRRLVNLCKDVRPWIRILIPNTDPEGEGKLYADLWRSGPETLLICI
jgi:hypothetical protein